MSEELDKVYEKYKPITARIASSYVFPEECEQEIWANVCCAKCELTEGVIVTIATRTRANLFRKWFRERKLDRSQLAADKNVQAPPSDLNIQHEDLIRSVNKKLESMRECDRRQALVLCDRLEIGEYAMQEGILEGSAKQRIRRAIPKLRRIFKEFEYDRN